MGIVYLNKVPLPRQAIGTFRYAEPDTAPTDYRAYEETTPDGAHYRVLLSPRGEKYLDNTDEFTVPANTYFMLGDNRDDSADSRDPASGVGFVPRNRLVGKAAFIYCSLDRGSARGFFSAIRWDRIGMPLS